MPRQESVGPAPNIDTKTSKMGQRGQHHALADDEYFVYRSQTGFSAFSHL